MGADHILEYHHVLALQTRVARHVLTHAFRSNRTRAQALHSSTKLVFALPGTPFEASVFEAGYREERRMRRNTYSESAR
jgi:hypothetical protein